MWQDKDRLWWLWIPMALLCLAAILALNAFAWPLIIVDDHGASHLAVFFAEVLLGMVALFVAPARAAQARQRALGRAAVGHGNSEAIPRAEIPTDAAQAPDVTTAPLVLMWRPITGMRHIYAAGLLFFGTLFLVSVVGFVLFVLLVLDVFQFGALASRWGVYTSPSEALLTGVICGAIGISGFVRVWPGVRGKPIGVMASDQGIQMRPKSRRPRLMAWHDMRPLEVAHKPNAPRNRFIVHIYDARGIITWTHPSPGATVVAVDGATYGEMHARAQALLDLIRARTGLVPRTFDTSLQPGGRLIIPRPLHRISTRALFNGWLILNILMLLLAGGTCYLPLTTSLAWNLAVAVIPLLGVLFAAIRSLAASRPDPQALAVRASLATTPPASAWPGIVFALAYVPSRRARLARALRAAPFAFAGLPTLLVLLSAITAVTRQSLDLPRFPSITAVALALSLELCIGLPAQALWIGALRVIPHYILADATGLSDITGKRRTTIAWSHVSEIGARERGGQIVSYYVRSQRNFPTQFPRSIIWQARPTQVRQIAPPDRMTAITPDELAALVAQRGGTEIKLI